MAAWKESGITSGELVSAGIERLQAGAFSQAALWFELATRLEEPGTYYLYTFARGRIAENQGKWQEAFDLYGLALMGEANSTTPIGSAYYRRGIILQDAWKDKETARIEYTQAISSSLFFSSLEYADALYRLGIIFHREGQKGQAIDLWEQACEIYPNHYGLLTELGWAYWEVRNQFNQAEETLQKAISVSRTGSLAYRLLGDLYRQNFQEEAAIEMYRTALRNNPDDRLAQHELEKIKGAP
jgi:tetratricopeptide (TPR) repeat protein